MINELLTKGAEVIFQDAHVSGHACQEEIKLIYTLVQSQVRGADPWRIQAPPGAAEDCRGPGALPKENVFMLSFRRRAGA